MKGMKRKIALAATIMVGMFIGAFRGEIAKQRYMAKAKNRYAAYKGVQQEDEILLDEFELSAFHSS
jgi:hypothetical protein